MSAVPLTLAVIGYVPAIVFAVAFVVATPFASVVTVVGDSDALGPLDGALNVTVTPGTGLPPASLTTTDRGDENGCATVALCGVPPPGSSDAGTPAMLLSGKLATPPTPATVAWTV